MKNIVILIFFILLNKIMDIYSPNFFIFYQLIKIQSNVLKKIKKSFVIIKLIIYQMLYFKKFY